MHHDAHVRVSVVVPTRKRPEQLREALASIRAVESPGVSLEILVCDNGDGEGAEAAREFGATHLMVARPGASAARNAGVMAATGEYLAFLDDDDVWLPGHLLPQLEMLKARPELGAVVGQAITTDDQRMPISAPWPVSRPDDGDLFPYFLAEYPQIGATVARTSVRESVGLLDETLFSDEDWDWHLRLALTHQIGFITAPSVLFRQRPAGSFDDLQWSRLGYMQRVLFSTMFRAGRRRPSLRTCLRIVVQHHGMYYRSFVESAVHHCAAGESGAAWRALGCASWTSPVHLARGLVRDRQTRQLLAALLLGRPAPQLSHGAADAPVVLALADRPDTSDDEQRSTYPASAAYPAPTEDWAPREVAR